MVGLSRAPAIPAALTSLLSTLGTCEGRTLLALPVVISSPQWVAAMYDADTTKLAVQTARTAARGLRRVL
jgi:hypothetical protein